jgi:small-conductance mechanosensitive channel
MIGAACSKVFEGILLILIRRPYNIGDRINVSDPNHDTPPSGSPGWIVKDVNLYSTTVVYGSTNEEATYANGSLAQSRIINCARSKNAVVWFLLKFSINTNVSHTKLRNQNQHSCTNHWSAFLNRSLLQVRDVSDL